MKEVFRIRAKSGGPIFFAWQKTQGNFLATTASDNFVRIYNRHGEQIEEFSLPGACTGFGWDQDGDILSIINDKSGVIFLWDANNRKLTQFDSGLRDTLSFMVWSKVDSILAIGTAKGNLLIYNHRSARKIPILGKHTRRITCGAWSKQNLIALGSVDQNLSISGVEGDTLHQIQVGGDIEEVQFSEMKRDEKSIGENTVSLIKNKKNLYLFNMMDPTNPIELSFQSRYGDLCTHRWYGDGYIVLGFQHGIVIVISTHLKEIGQEVYQVKEFQDGLCSITVSTAIGKVAFAGDNCVKVHELSDLTQMNALLTMEEERSLDRIAWTEDGQLLAASTSRGYIHIFLTKLPVLGAYCMTRVAYLTSLLEITIQDIIRQERPVSVPIEVEPSFVALGPDYLVAGMNNRAWFYALTDQGVVKLKEREYMGTVQACKINNYYAAVRFDGRINLHMIEDPAPGASSDKEAKMFPEKDQGKERIMCHDITRDFLIYGTDKGKICYFHIEDWAQVNECDHNTTTASHGGVVGIRKLFADPSGTRLIYIDDKSDGFVYNPVNDSTLEIPEISSKTTGVLWDSFPPDRGIFITYDSEKINTYLYERESIKGAHVVYIGESRLPFGQEPLLLYGGQLTLQTSSGMVQMMVLNTHSFVEYERQQTVDQKQSSLKKSIALKRYADAWHYCVELATPESWDELGRATIFSLDVEFALKVYRAIGDVGMVMSLNSIKSIEDRSLLAGYLSMFLSDFSLAQDHFLASGRPVAALEMRRDLMNWDTALQLAKTLAADEIPYISREYAQQLEFTGDYQSALRHYEAGVTRDPARRDHDESCAAGVARMAIRTGDLRRGVGMALKMPSPSLKKECAAILESMKQFVESATLYEKGGFYDKAASVYIRAKNWSKVGELLPQVTAPKIHVQYARAKEAEGRYKEAAAAYENAKDWESVIRVNLDHLQNPNEAVRVVRATQSIDGAKMVAKYFENMKDFSSAIQFLVLSKCNDEAFQMAQKHGHMEKYADIIGADATAEDYQSIAVYFEGEKNHFFAGKFFYLSGQYSRAIKHLLCIPEGHTNNTDALNLAVDVIASANDIQLTNHLMSYFLGDVDDNPKALSQLMMGSGDCCDGSIELAIETVAKSGEASLTRQLIAYLMGERDGTVKDPKFLFRLYMALKQYREAARTASVIAREEQNAGSYRTAHDLLFSMYQELRKNKIKIPADMANSLTILHSYILVKMQIKREEHLKAARMLIRVANNISKFPSHIVPILTTTVIECQRAGLKNSAFSFAAMLMRPEYRDSIDLKYKKKLEMIVRKPDKSELEEPKSPCPFCNTNLPETELVCFSCKNNIPFCIATGRHVLRQEMTVCPSCQFPAIMPEFLALLASEDARCPMCSENIDVKNVEPLDDVSQILNPEDGSVE